MSVPGPRAKGFNIRVTPDELKEWEWGARAFADETSTDANVSAFVRAAVKKEIRRYRGDLAAVEPMPKKKERR